MRLITFLSFHMLPPLQIGSLAKSPASTTLMTDMAPWNWKLMESQPAPTRILRTSSLKVEKNTAPALTCSTSLVFGGARDGRRVNRIFVAQMYVATRCCPLKSVDWPTSPLNNLRISFHQQSFHCKGSRRCDSFHSSWLWPGTVLFASSVAHQSFKDATK